MSGQPSLQHWLATVDVRELSTLRWGPMRLMFRSFVEEIELARYLKTLLSGSENRPVTIEPHRGPDGRPSTHVFDVFRVEKLESVG
jgi:hypothetical protein